LNLTVCAAFLNTTAYPLRRCHCDVFRVMVITITANPSLGIKNFNFGKLHASYNYHEWLHLLRDHNEIVRKAPFGRLK
jgi:hypothetical protein